MGIRIISKTSAQKLQQFPILPRRRVVQPATWYLCPAGKKALVVGTCQCTGQGGATSLDMDIQPLGITKFRWLLGVPILNDKCKWNPFGLLVGNDTCPFRIELSAGESIETNQNASTNGEFNLDLEVFESDV